MSRLLPRRLAAVAAAALLLAACGDGGGEDEVDSAQAPDEELAVLVASFDVAVGDDQRLMAGLLTADAVQLGFGEVTFDVGPVGADGGVQTRDTATARFLPALGLEPEGEGDQPRLLVGETGRGVYEGRVALDEPGTWGIHVTAELDDGTTRTGIGTFEVADAPQIPAPGDPAPRTENLTVADVEAGDATPVSVDSRAQAEDAEVPDTHIHDTRIADALDTGDPLVVVVSTPTYCVSVFCGPLTEELAELATAYEDDVTVVHLEVWRDFENQELNAAAAEWIALPTGGGNEPWVFLVDGEGTIHQRWDNVLDLEALEAELQDLL